MEKALFKKGRCSKKQSIRKRLFCIKPKKSFLKNCAAIHKKTTFLYKVARRKSSFLKNCAAIHKKTTFLYKVARRKSSFLKNCAAIHEDMEALLKDPVQHKFLTF